jgi:WD40 repeat protein
MWDLSFYCSRECDSRRIVIFDQRRGLLRFRHDDDDDDDDGDDNGDDDSNDGKMAKLFLKSDVVILVFFVFTVTAKLVGWLMKITVYITIGGIHLKISPDGSFLVSASGEDGYADVWDYKTNTVMMDIINNYKNGIYMEN